MDPDEFDPWEEPALHLGESGPVSTILDTDGLDDLPRSGRAGF